MYWSAAFWKASAERAIKTGAQMGATVISLDLASTAVGGVVNSDLLQATWASVALTALVGAVYSLLTSIASAQFGTPGSPSLVAGSEVKAATG